MTQYRIVECVYGYHLQKKFLGLIWVNLTIEPQPLDYCHYRLGNIIRDKINRQRYRESGGAKVVYTRTV